MYDILINFSVGFILKNLIGDELDSILVSWVVSCFDEVFSYILHVICSLHLYILETTTSIRYY
jgi:hypothetical protein